MHGDAESAREMEKWVKPSLFTLMGKVIVRTSGVVKSSPAIGRFGAVYFGSADAKVYAVHGTTGALLWTFTTGGPVYSSPAIDADGTVYVGSNDQKLYALNYLDGGKIWEFRAAGLITTSPVVSSDGRVFVALEDGTLYSLDKVTGQELWHTALGGSARRRLRSTIWRPTILARAWGGWTHLSGCW